MSAAPAVSAIVPTRDRPAALATCLEALAAQRERDLEVIVVDDGGSTPLEPVVEAVADRVPVVLVRHDGTGPAGARNRGAAGQPARRAAAKTRPASTRSRTHESGRVAFTCAVRAAGSTRTECPWSRSSRESRVSERSASARLSPRARRRSRRKALLWPGRSSSSDGSTGGTQGP